VAVLLCFFFLRRRPPSSTLFPYMTLFRSLEQREVCGDVRTRAGVRLDVGVVGTEQRLRPLDGELLDDIDELAATVVPLARKSLGVLVGQDRADGVQDRLAHVVLRRDELDTLALALLLAADRGRNLRIGRRQQRRCGHARSPCSA